MIKIKIGISRCLLGEQVRYDGGHKHDRFLTDTLGKYVDFCGICPEVEYGLPVPREAMHLEGDPEMPRLVTIRTGIDHTEGMLAWAARRLDDLAKEDLCGFIFKSKSPSSGMRNVKVFPAGGGMPSHKGVGLFADSLMKRFPLIPAEDDGRLNDPGLRENFIERVFVFHHWQEMMKRSPTKKNLIDFHTEHKLLVLSHSPKHYTELGRLVASPEKDTASLFSRYIVILMSALRLMATSRKNTNVLMHIAGYFKRWLSADEKSELLDVINEYRLGLIPLIVPVTLLKHYVRKYDEPYLKRQVYLNPHPLELMLRNHV